MFIPAKAPVWLMIQSCCKQCACPISLPVCKLISHNRGNYDAQAPWSMADVCRGWRELAISCPDLWTKIEHDNSRSNLALNELRLALQLRRADYRHVVVRLNELRGQSIRKAGSRSLTTFILKNVAERCKELGLVTN